MLKTLGTIVKDNWVWRSQIGSLAIFDLKKKSRGAVLSWAWFFVKPAMYVFCFWFALSIGLKAEHTIGGADLPPYILWLTAGLVPWFFMQDLLNSGVDAMHRYPYLVNKIKFPLSAISTICTGSTMVIQLLLQAALLVMYFACGQALDIHLIQIPILLAIMFLFWDIFSILFSQLSVMSKDIKNLVKAFSTPLFWLSGILFSVESIHSNVLQTVLAYNPVTFFATAFRDAYYYKTWFWEDPHLCFGMGIVFLVTLIAAIFVYKRFNQEVADVL